MGFNHHEFINQCLLRFQCICVTHRARIGHRKLKDDDPTSQPDCGNMMAVWPMRSRRNRMRAVAACIAAAKQTDLHCNKGGKAHTNQ